MKINLSTLKDLTISVNMGLKNHSKPLYTGGQVVYLPMEENGLELHTGGFYGI